MEQLSDRLNRLAPSATLAMSQKSSEMKAQGIDVINMSVGEPDFNTPDAIKEAAKKAIDDNYSKYSPVPGYPDLRKAIVEKLKRENQLNYTTNEVIVGTGGKQCVCNAILALVNPGDEVIIPAPYWVSYPQMVKLAGGVPVIVRAGFEQNFKINAEQLEKAITPKTKMLILCSPSNPTGSVYTKQELEALAAVIKQHKDLFVLADEIYEHINYVGAHASIAQVEGMKEQTIIANGVSKAYAMTGWRIGNIIAPDYIIKIIQQINENVVFTAPSISQRAAIYALRYRDQVQPPMVEEYRRRMFYAAERISKIPKISVINPPKGSFYLFINIKETGLTSTEAAEMFLTKAHVNTLPGNAFGECGEGYVRIACTVGIEELEKAFDRIEKALLE